MAAPAEFGIPAMPITAGFYERRVFPWLNDRLCADPRIERLRHEVLLPARGRVIEIGFGSGLNLPQYPAAVTAVVAVEPNPGMTQRALPRMQASPVPVQALAATAERIPLPDASFDTAVSVLTLCSVDDPARVLAELRRVLRDDGQLLLLEHGLSDEPGVARWQRRLNGIQRALACGCNLDRPIAALARAAGFRFEALQQFYAPKMPRTHGWLTLARAAKA